MFLKERGGKTSHSCVRHEKEYSNLPEGFWLGGQATECCVCSVKEVRFVMSKTEFLILSHGQLFLASDTIELHIIILWLTVAQQRKIIIEKKICIKKIISLRCK